VTARRPARALDSPAVRSRIRQLAAENGHRLAVAAFRAEHAAREQAKVDALILETVALLAELLGGPAGTVCPACRRALAPRVRNCPHCRQDAAVHSLATVPAGRRAA